jgi:metallo-beta-lactamase family protein
MSAHADATQIIQWLKTLKKAPHQVFITHGEPEAADALRWRIEHELGWSATVPLLGQHARIDAF